MNFDDVRAYPFSHGAAIAITEKGTVNPFDYVSVFSTPNLPLILV